MLVVNIAATYTRAATKLRYIPHIKPTKLRKTILFERGIKLNMIIDAIGQILYPATIIGMVSLVMSAICVARFLHQVNDYIADQKTYIYNVLPHSRK